MPIKVLKASAGSGKTYTLANEYLDLLEKSLHSQILAVTFTNKATEEMKSRIVKELNERAKEKDDKVALEYLKSILHDYSHFNINGRVFGAVGAEADSDKATIRSTSQK